MKNWFNEQGTITGWVAIGRTLVAALVYAIALTIFNATANNPIYLFLLIPAVVFYVWLMVATALKRFKAFGFEGRWYNLMFPSLTDGTYPNRKK